MRDILSIQHLTRRYEGFTLDDVSLTVPAGCIVGLIGENGAGKSTTLSAALGLIRADGGETRFFGENLSTNPALMEDIGAVLDGVGLHESLTVRQAARVHAAAYRKWDEALFRDFLRRFSLPEKKRIRELSKGMKMKLALALALSHRPKLLILDEATSGLDPVMRDDLLDVFLEFVQDEEHSILMSSHISTDLEKAADYLVFIHHGKVLFACEKDELRDKWGVLRCGETLFQRLDKDRILAFRKEAYQYSVLVSDKADCRRQYPDAAVDDATIDETLLLYVKGVHT